MKKSIFRKYRPIIILLLLLLPLQTISGQVNLPEKPLLKYVTVDTSDNTVLIEWSPSTTPNIQCYKIYSLNVQTFPVTGIYIDSVLSDVLQYKHLSDPNDPLFYSVTAVNAVGESLLSGDYHRHSKLDVSYDSCSQEMTLNWEKYLGWEGHITGYRVLCNDGSGSFSELALLDTTKLSYIHSDILENQTYDYLIKTFDNRLQSSLSNIRSYFTYMPPPPSFINLDYVSALDDLTLEISFTTDLSGEINDFRLMRASSSEASFTNWKTITDIDQSPYLFNDQVATQGVRTYYRVDALNSCLDPIMSSNTGSNIVLSGEVEGSVATLNWNPYKEFKGGIEAYLIYRQNQLGDFEQVATAQSEAVSYIEDLSMIGQGQIRGEIIYQIVAEESGNNPNGIKGRSVSNTLSINVETQLFIPNAFTPNDDGMNDTFGPVLDFTPEDYRMLIYDRTGKILFQTIDPLDGWDGTLDGSTAARQGVYIYHIEYTSYSGVRKVQTGNLSLINP